MPSVISFHWNIDFTLRKINAEVFAAECGFDKNWYFRDKKTSCCHCTVTLCNYCMYITSYIEQYLVYCTWTFNILVEETRSKSLQLRYINMYNPTYLGGITLLFFSKKMYSWESSGLFLWHSTNFPQTFWTLVTTSIPLSLLH